MPKRMELEEVMKYRSVDGKVYSCDVRRWIGDEAWDNIGCREQTKLVDTIDMLAKMKEKKD